MQLAFLSQNARSGDAIGGQLAGQVRAARADGHTVRCYVSETAKLRSDVADVAIGASPRELWRSPRDRDYLLHCDLILAAYGGDYPLLDLLPLLARRGRRIAFCYYGVTPPELWPESDRPRLERARERRNWVWFADQALAISEFAANELHEHTGYPRERIHVLHCFVEAVPRSDLNVRRSLGLDEQPVVLFVGRLAPNKDLPTLLRAFQRARMDRPDLQLVVAGASDDVYAQEAQQCQALARQLGIDQQVHWPGPISEAEKAAWYRQANVLVLPSRHECFGLPPMEAAAAGIPVIASQAGALPETLGQAALTFRTGDADDLARQLRRVLAPAGIAPAAALSGKAPAAAPAHRRVAIVAPRFGCDFAGGAEQSLRRMALALATKGHMVDVFTTCNRHDCHWDNHYPAGTTRLDGLYVHRFPIDEFDAVRLAQACEEIQHAGGKVDEATAISYVGNSLGSSRLLEALTERAADFSAILAGPYLFKLTWQAAVRFREKMLLVPCFHDEPYAHLELLTQAYHQVGGYLFHSEEEMEFAQRELGQTHPRSTVAGTTLGPGAGGGDAKRGRRLAGERYFAYCGRFCAEKGLDRLLDWFARLADQRPDLRLVLIGQGAMPLPKARWLQSLGFVAEQTKYDVLAGARALINLSRNESLSIVLLEAWAQGVPVIGNGACRVVRRQIERARGGFAVETYAEFEQAVCALEEEDELRARLGDSGRRMVAERYQNPEAYADRLAAAVADLSRPLPELMRREGMKRAASFGVDVWQPRFLHHLRAIAGGAERRRRNRIRIAGGVPIVECGAGAREVLTPIRVQVVSDLPVSGAGLGRRVVWTQVLLPSGRPAAPPRATPLPGLLVPGRAELVAARLRLPRRAGRYRIAVRIAGPRLRRPLAPSAAAIPLSIGPGHPGVTVAKGFLEAARAALAQAHRKRKLPTEYVDVTEGRFARIKAWIKHKLLNNLRKAYLMPMARQQSAVNEGVLAALSQLTEALAVHGSAAATTTGNPQELRRLRKRVAMLEAQLRELTARS
jgi:glycosyltransferase involved in cell wall biosynthesis